MGEWTDDDTYTLCLKKNDTTQPPTIILTTIV